MFFLAELFFESHKPKLAVVGALFASVYYVLNFSTVQQFATQLEAFIIHFGAIPWLFYLAYAVTRTWNTRLLVWFFVLSILSSTQGFIPPLFIAYFITLCILLSCVFIANPNKYHAKIFLLLTLGTLCINAYWLFPVSHFTLTSGANFLEANNNLLSTQSWIDANSTFGTIEHLANLKGFPSQAVNTISQNNTIHVFQEWLEHLDTTSVRFLGMLSFILICFGAISLTLFAKRKQDIWIVISGILFFSILATEVPYLQKVSEALQEIPILRQAFRAGFTKLSILLSLSYSICFAYGLVAVFHYLSHLTIHSKLTRSGRRILGILVCVGTLMGAIYYALPSFQGHFLYSRLKISPPAAYKRLFTYLATVPVSGRVMLLPQGDHWGWNTYNWGYTGSGFSWFGMRQPILERAFDVWSPYNENYYWELSQALYSNDREGFIQVLDKYQISWVLFDSSMVPFLNAKQLIYTEKIHRMLKTVPNLTLVRSYPLQNAQKNSLVLYRYEPAHSHDALTFTDDISILTQPFHWIQKDYVYQLYGAYASSMSERDSDTSIHFPFRALATQRPQKNEAFSISEDNTDILITTNNPTNLKANTLEFSNMSDMYFNYPISETNTPRVSVSINDIEYHITGSSSSGRLDIPQDEIYSFITRIAKQPVYISSDQQELKPYVHRCDDNETKGQEKTTILTESEKTIYSFHTIHAGSCYDLNLPEIQHNYAYILAIETQHKSGSPLTLEIINNTSTRKDATIQLSRSLDITTHYVILPPMESDGIGYSFRIANTSTTTNPTTNDLRNFTLYALPYETLATMRLIQGNISQIYGQGASAGSITYRRNSPISYTAQVQTNTNIPQDKNTLILSQSYDDGWKAYIKGNFQFSIFNFQLPNTVHNWLFETFPFLFGTEVKEHVLVNNWQNGWILPKESINNESPVIVIFFWPQLLEWFGFLLLPIPFLIAKRLHASR